MKKIGKVRVFSLRGFLRKAILDVLFVIVMMAADLSFAFLQAASDEPIRGHGGVLASVSFALVAATMTLYLFLWAIIGIVRALRSRRSLLLE